ncbi:PucR family transcriptional regulator [Paenibacillus campi]|uniref:PucR family transcriptional regulator n=1 Tax=Paenibacillus campi TaxID=3106031 RepID=UPI002AFFA47A|nr:PucR family transcriptional regulator [Paenibacillus sp. SGZ-1009]
MSSITVEEAMTVGALKRARMLAGFSGLKNPIEHVTVLEIPDSEEWFKGHELIITAFYHIRDDVQRQLALLDKMKLMHAAALALCYPGLHYHTLSEQVLRRAEQLQIPIIEIPRDVPYIDIISPVVQEIQKHRSLEIKQMLEIQNQLTVWLAQKLDPTVIIPNIGVILGDPLLLVDAQYNQLASYQIELSSQHTHLDESYTGKHNILAQPAQAATSDDGNCSDETADDCEPKRKHIVPDTAPVEASYETPFLAANDMDDTTEPSNDPHSNPTGEPTYDCIPPPIQSIASGVVDAELDRQHYIVEVIQSAERVYGYLCAWSEERMPPFKEMLYHSVAVSLALYFSQEDAIQSATRDYQQTVLLHWLNGQEITPDQLERSMRETGYDLHAFAGMAIVTADDREQHHELARQTADWCKANEHKLRCMIIHHGYQLVLLLEQPAQKAASEYEAFLTSMRRQIAIDHTIMYNRIAHELAQEGAALYRSLQDVLYFRQRIPALPDVMDAARLPIFHLLRMSRTATWLSPLRALVQPLIDYDQRMNADFMVTLEYFLFYPEQQELPDVLHIHRNTLNYRKQRITEILGINPFENPYRMQFELALLVHHIVQQSSPINGKYTK